MRLARSRGRGGEIKPPFDALQAVTMAVEPLVDICDVALDIYQAPLYRGYALAEIPHVIPQRSYVGADRAQMFEN